MTARETVAGLLAEAFDRLHLSAVVELGAYRQHSTRQYGRSWTWRVRVLPKDQPRARARVVDVYGYDTLRHCAAFGIELRLDAYGASVFATYNNQPPEEPTP